MSPSSSYQPDHDAHIVIVGGGIGGLTTALSLHAAGFRNISVYEAAPMLTTLGVGINVQPHAVLVLRNLGLLPALEATAVSTQELNFYNSRGDEILREPRGQFAGYHVPQFSIHRGEFQQLLLATAQERLGKDRVHLGHAFVGFEQDADSITARFTSRPDLAGKPPAVFHGTVKGAILLAADGINSTVRRILYPAEGPPRFSGRILWRGCIERPPFLTGGSMVWAGHANQKFIAYPISGASARKTPAKSLVNWIAELRVRDENDPDLTPPPTDWTKTVEKSKFAGPFQGWKLGGLDVGKLIDETDKVFEFPMCDREPVSKWTFGRLTLLGDAAHPMYPIGSNGASQAILDASSLTTHLSKLPVLAALTAYEGERLPPTRAIVFANRANGPDQVLQLAYERAPQGFKHVHDIIPAAELESVGAKYKAIAGFERDNVNKLAKDTEGQAEKKGLGSPKGWIAGSEVRESKL